MIPAGMTRHRSSSTSSTSIGAYSALTRQPRPRALKWGRIVTWAADREADTQQAQVFHSLLAERRAELCDRLDEQAIKLARYEQSRDSARARRKRGRIKEIGAEIRDIDRMMQGLRVQLLGVEHKRSRV